MAMKRILAYCEGQTEVLYLKKLTSLFGLSKTSKIELAPRHEPLHMLEDATKELYWSQLNDPVPFDHAWIIGDQDHHPGYDKAYEISLKIPDVDFVWSNPCIEFWFLLHFVSLTEAKAMLKPNSNYTIAECSERIRLADNEYRIVTTKLMRQVVDPDSCLKILKAYWPGYKKNQTENLFQVLVSKTLKAASEARPCINPKRLGSAFPRFIDYLSSGSDKSIEKILPSEPSNPVASNFGYWNKLRNSMTGKSARDIDRLIDFLHQAKCPIGINAKDTFGTQNKCKALLKSINVFNFSSENDLLRAQYAAMTAACAPWLDRVPIIVLNCLGRGRNKEYFAKFLSGLCETEAVKIRKFPSRMPKDMGKQKVVVFHATKGSNQWTWLQNAICTEETKLIVIYGNNLKLTDIGNYAIKINFSQSIGKADEFKNFCSQNITWIRQHLRYAAAQRNKPRNRNFSSPQTNLVLWHCLCYTTMVWMKYPAIQIIKFPTIEKEPESDKKEVAMILADVIAKDASDPKAEMIH